MYLPNDQVWRVSFLQAKQQRETTESCYFIPYNILEGIPLFGVIVETYLSTVESDLVRRNVIYFVGRMERRSKINHSAST